MIQKGRPMTYDEKLDDNFFDGTLEQAIRVLAYESADPIVISCLLEAEKRLRQSRLDIPRLLDDIEKLTHKDECITWCEGCSAPLLTCDDYATGDDCSGCWSTMAEGDWPDKPCYAYRVGKRGAQDRYRDSDIAKAIEARSDKTGTGLAEGESAAPQGFAQHNQESTNGAG